MTLPLIVQVPAPGAMACAGAPLAPGVCDAGWGHSLDQPDQFAATADDASAWSATADDASAWSATADVEGEC
jgi:hypothetical protein